jgi:hypothetical protein
MKFSPDPIGQMLGTGYKRFESSVGINGLAKVTGLRIDILAVVATRQRTGQFRRFIAAVKNTYDVIAVWEDWNPVIGAALQRYGFHRAAMTGIDGETGKGWIFGVKEPLYSIGTWDSESQSYLPHPGLPAFNVTRKSLVDSMKILRRQGYSCHRYRGRDENGKLNDFAEDSDPRVFIGRTDGKTEAEILESWKR